MISYAWRARALARLKSVLKAEFIPIALFKRHNSDSNGSFFNIGGECVRNFGKLPLSFIKNKWSLNFKDSLRCGYYCRAHRRCTPTPPRVKNLTLVLCAIMAIKHRWHCKLKTDGWDRLGMYGFVSPNLFDYTWKNSVSPSASREYFYTYLQRKRV